MGVPQVSWRHLGWPQQLQSLVAVDEVRKLRSHRQECRWTICSLVLLLYGHILLVFEVVRSVQVVLAEDRATLLWVLLLLDLDCIHRRLGRFCIPCLGRLDQFLVVDACDFTAFEELNLLLLGLDWVDRQLVLVVLRSLGPADLGAVETVRGEWIVVVVVVTALDLDHVVRRIALRGWSLVILLPRVNFVDLVALLLVALFVPHLLLGNVEQ